MYFYGKLTSSKQWFCRQQSDIVWHLLYLLLLLQRAQVHWKADIFPHWYWNRCSEPPVGIPLDANASIPWYQLLASLLLLDDVPRNNFFRGIPDNPQNIDTAAFWFSCINNESLCKICVKVNMVIQFWHHFQVENADEKSVRCALT